MRRFLIASLLASTALPAQAEDRSLWSLLHPDQIMNQVLRSGILALRTQLDLRYSDLSVSLADGRISADDVSLVLYDNITDGDICEVDMAGLEILTGDPFAIDDLQLTLAARSVQLSETCLPSEARQALAVVGQTRLFIPELVIDIAYDMPTASAQIGLSAAVEDVAAIRADIDMAYVTVWAGDTDEGELSGELRAASVVLEDLGGWDRVAPLLPPPFTNPDTAGAAVAQTLGQMFEDEANGQVTPKSAKTFTAEVARGWADFVTDPGRLVLETGFNPAEPKFVDPEELEGGPFAVIELLEPVVTRVPAAERSVIAPALLAQALDAPDSLGATDRRAVGLALLTGRGAPLAVDRGTELLMPLLEGGDGEVALAVAHALSASAPDMAYAAALAAGGTGTPGVRPTLDALEESISFTTRLRLQEQANYDVEQGDLRASPRELAVRAEAHFSGTGAPRSLTHALLFASVAAAQGHGGAARLLERIERSIPEDGRAAWTVASADVAERALGAWIAGVQ